VLQKSVAKLGMFSYLTARLNESLGWLADTEKWRVSAGSGVVGRIRRYRRSAGHPGVLSPLVRSARIPAQKQYCGRETAMSESGEGHPDERSQTHPLKLTGAAQLAPGTVARFSSSWPQICGCPKSERRDPKPNRLTQADFTGVMGSDSGCRPGAPESTGPPGQRTPSIETPSPSRRCSDQRRTRYPALGS
jgi:hypothetical protein